VNRTKWFWVCIAVLAATAFCVGLVGAAPSKAHFPWVIAKKLTVESTTAMSGNITLENGETISNSTDGVIAVDGTFDITAAGGLKLSNDETITNAVNGAVVCDGSFDITAAGGLILSNDETITNAVNGAVVCDGSFDITSAGGLILSNDETITNAVNGAVVCDGSFDITSAGGLILNNDETITNAVNGAVVCDGSFDITSAGGLILSNDETITNAVNGAVVCDGSFDITAAGGLILSNDETITNAVDGQIVMGGIIASQAGDADTEIIQRIGATATEGLEIVVIDEDLACTSGVFTNFTTALPAGSVILSVQANLETIIVGADDNDNGLVKIGVGAAADPDLYGKTADLLKNSKIDTIPDWAVLGATQLRVNAVDAAGAIVTETLASGTARVRVVYLALNSLDDAP